MKFPAWLPFVRPPPPPLPPTPAVLSVEPIALSLLGGMLVLLLLWRLKGARRPSPSLLGDPRQQLLEFFAAGDARGPKGVLHSHAWQPSGQPSEYFSVWRPTSLDAINLMMEGRATGKGLNVKGKSAKKGELSGYVPFLQISEESHKRLVGTSPSDAMLRVYYRNAEQRDEAAAVLQPVLESMAATALAAHEVLATESAGDSLGDDIAVQRAMEDLKYPILPPHPLRPPSTAPHDAHAAHVAHAIRAT